MNDPTFQLDRTAFSVISLGDDPGDKAYWLSKTPDERMAALEFMRQVAYGYDPETARIEKIFEVVECPWALSL